jgi:hypothetical protein
MFISNNQSEIAIGTFDEVNKKSINNRFSKG